MVLKVLPSAIENAKLLTEIFSEHSNLDDAGIYSSAFHPRSNFKLHSSLSANPEKWSNTLKQIVGNLPTICFECV